MKLRTITVTMTAIVLLLLGVLHIGRAQDEESRNHVLHALGGPFFVSRDKVQEDLKLSDDQKRRLRETLTGYIEKALPVQNLKGAERERAMRSLRQQSSEQLDASLKELLTPEQLGRFEQLKLQYDVPSVFLGPRVGQELKVTDEQRQQFMGAIQEMQKGIEPLIKEARSGGRPQEILPKVIKMRRDCEEKIKTFLTDAQKQQWKAMTGPPLDIW